MGLTSVHLANATRIVRGCGVALFRYGDRDAVAEVIFGEPGDAILLGAFTLEALGLCLVATCGEARVARLRDDGGRAGAARSAERGEREQAAQAAEPRAA